MFFSHQIQINLNFSLHSHEKRCGEVRLPSAGGLQDVSGAAAALDGSSPDPSLLQNHWHRIVLLRV